MTYANIFHLDILAFPSRHPPRSMVDNIGDRDDDDDDSSRNIYYCFPTTRTKLWNMDDYNNIIIIHILSYSCCWKANF